MRYLPVALVCVAVSTASFAAPGTPVETAKQVVLANLAGVAKRLPNAKLGFAKNPFIQTGGAPSYGLADVAEQLFPPDARLAIRPTGAFAAGTVDNVVWFDQAYDWKHEGTNAAPPEVGKSRAHGLAIVDGGTVKIVALHYAALMADKDLFAGNGRATQYLEMKNGLDDVSGDRELASLLSDCVGRGFEPEASADHQLIVGGTAPKEFGTGASGIALVKGWKKLKLEVLDTDARTYADGKVGFVVGRVSMVRGKTKIGMTVSIAAIKDGPVNRLGKPSWRWVSVQFSA